MKIRHPKQLALIDRIEAAISAASKAPDTLKVNSEYRLLLNSLNDALAYAKQLHVKKPKRYYGSW